MTSSEYIDFNNQIVELPPTILDYYENVKLSADVIHVNDVLFPTSISNHIYYWTSNVVDNMNAKMLEVGLINIIKSYAIRGFSVGVMFLDIQFKCVKDRNNLV